MGILKLFLTHVSACILCPCFVSDSIASHKSSLVGEPGGTSLSGLLLRLWLSPGSIYKRSVLC